MDICKIVKPVGAVAKFGTSVVGGAAAGFVVDGMVKALLPAPVKPVGKILTIVGTSMLSGALADVAVDKWCDSIDAVTGFFSKEEEAVADESDFECDKENPDFFDEMLTKAAIRLKNELEAAGYEMVVTYADKDTEEESGDIRPTKLEVHAAKEASCIV